MDVLSFRMNLAVTEALEIEKDVSKTYFLSLFQLTVLKLVFQLKRRESNQKVFEHEVNLFFLP